MNISELKLTNFKNYQDESFTFSPKYNAIVGYNGVGKTNLLDAIYFACMTKSNFIKQDRSLVRDQEGFFRLEAIMEKKSVKGKVVCKFEKSKKKIFEFNKKVYEKLADHIGRYPIVFIVPGDQSLISEGSKERRRLMDNTLSQLDKEYLFNLISYNALLRQRNAYLKSVQKSARISTSLPFTYSEQMAVCASYIFEARNRFVDEFSSRFAKKYEKISGNEELASCKYSSQLLENDFMTLTNEQLDKDRILGRTTVGIHKDDLSFYMNEKSVKDFASQGQTKSFVLSIKLAQFDIITEDSGVKPILLLDDLFDKLDQKRVHQLIALLETEKVDQVFISDTDENRVIHILKGMEVEFKKIVIQNGLQKISEAASEEE